LSFLAQKQAHFERAMLRFALKNREKGGDACGKSHRDGCVKASSQ
jgi:hypothetical protein